MTDAVHIPRWWRCVDAAFFLALSPRAVQRLVRGGRLPGEVRSTRTRAPSTSHAYRRAKFEISHAGLWRDAAERCRRRDGPVDPERLVLMRRIWPAPKWFTSAEAAALLGVSSRYVRMLYRAGRLEGEIRTTRFRAPGWPHAYRRRKLMIFGPSVFVRDPPNTGSRYGRSRRMLTGGADEGFAGVDRWCGGDRCGDRVRVRADDRTPTAADDLRRGHGAACGHGV